jgi:hypothetical protein
VAYTPSSGLLLRRGEHSAVLAGAQAHLDGCPDEPDPEAEVLGLRQADVVLQTPCALDASADAHPDEAADAVHPPFPAVLEDAGAGKLVDPALDDQAQDAFLVLLPALLAREEPDEAAVLCKQAAARSAARSCAEQAAAVQQPAKSSDAAAMSRPVA